jgi:hypothetical protein
VLHAPWGLASLSELIQCVSAVRHKKVYSNPLLTVDMFTK